jgi:hypothetical protein
MERVMPLSDLDEDRDNGGPFALMVPAEEQMVEELGKFLDAADNQLFEWERDNGVVISDAIYRGSQELARAVGIVAEQLESQSDDDLRAIAEACRDDVHAHCLALQDESQQQEKENTVHKSLLPPSPNDLPDDFAPVLRGVAVLLRDVQATLSAVERSEAEEVADVALIAARLFVTSMQSWYHSNETREALQSTKTNGMVIQELPFDEDDCSESLQPSDEEQDRYNSSKPRSSAAQKQQRFLFQRFRVLWPPLGPQVQQACAWGQQAATEQPVLAVALGLILWPTAVVAACIVPPALLADHVLQNVYESGKDGPLVTTLEGGAANVAQSARLAFVSSRFVVRQGLRIANRQADRHGGWPGLAQACLGWTVDRVLHPVATLQMVGDGLQWTQQRVVEILHHFSEPDQTAVLALSSESH